MKAMMIKEIKELGRDRRTLSMLLALPLLLIIFGYAANFTVDRIPTTIIGPDANTIAAELRGALAAGVGPLDVIAVEPDRPGGDAEAILRARESAAVLSAHGRAAPGAPLAERIDVSLDGSNLFVAQAGKLAIAGLTAEDARLSAEAAVAELEQARAALERAPAPGGPEPPPFPELTVPQLDPDALVSILFNPDLTTSWVMVPGLIGLILTFIGTLITSIGLVREREAGTLEQLAVMPLRPTAVILGKIAPYFGIGLLDLALVTALGVALFGVPFRGSPWLFALVAVVFLFVVLGLGVFVSSLSQTIGQAVQLATLIVVPQVLLSGLIFPLDSMPIGVRWIGYVLPLTWFREAVTGIMLRDAQLGEIWGSLAVLAAMAVLIFGAATVRMHRALSRGGARP